MKHTILHADAEAAAAFEDNLRRCRDLQRQMRAQPHSHTPKFRLFEQAFDILASEIVDDMLAAAVVSSDELDAAEAMLHGMRLAVPQDEMGS